MRYPAVCSCFLPLIVHFIIAQAADLVLAQTAGAGSPDSAAGVSVLTSAVCIPLFALWLRSEEKFREEKAAGADRTAWICLAFALYHGNPLQFLYAFPMGLVMQYFLEKGGSLACPAACHMAANLTSILAESIL